jgi:hypothetical protein
MSFMDFLNPLSNKDSIFYPSLDPLGLVMKKGGKNGLAALGTPSYGAPTRWDQYGNGYADPTYGGQAPMSYGQAAPSFNYNPMLSQGQQTQGLSPNAATEQPYYQQPQAGNALNASSYGGFDQWNPQSWGQRRINPLTRR